MTTLPNPLAREEVKTIATQIATLSEFNSTSMGDMAMYFQILLSAKESRVFMEAPGLYFPDLPILVISKSGIKRGHATIYNSISPLIPEAKRRCYAFVLYPESFFRTCFDRVLRNTAKIIVKDLRMSMENVFNRKYYTDSLVDSDVEQEIISFMRRDL
jgi:hypothetical protein